MYMYMYMSSMGKPAYMYIHVQYGDARAAFTCRIELKSEEQKWGGGGGGGAKDHPPASTLDACVHVYMYMLSQRFGPSQLSCLGSLVVVRSV